MSSFELDSIPDRIELDRELASRGLLAFLRVIWPQVEKDPLVLGWHNEMVCEVLEAVSAGEIRDLVINQPPGTTKSLTTAVAWPVWEWLEIDPALRYIYGTYADSLSKRDAGRVKTLVDSPWFQARWPAVSFPQAASRSMGRLQNSAGGVRFSTSVKGGVTGHHAHRIVVDDPLKPMDAVGSRAALRTELDLVREWWDTTLSTRQADPKRTARVVVMQRLHKLDLAAKVLEETDGVVHLSLPMEYERKFHCRVKWQRTEVDEAGKATEVEVVREDPRTEEGELLCPERFPLEEVKKLKRMLKAQGSAAQLQQRPTPAGGLTFQKSWIKYWGVPGTKYRELPARRREIQIWDMTFKGAPTPGKKRSFVCGQVWAQVGADMLLLGQERGQWAFVEQQKALKRLTGSFPKAHRKYVEDAANGAAIVDALEGKVSGLKLVGTGGGSEPRAEVASVFFESGNVFFPHPSIAPWVDDLEEELLSFPMARHDDMVDCVSHAVVLLSEAAHASFAEAMKKVRSGGAAS